MHKPLAALAAAACALAITSSASAATGGDVSLTKTASWSGTGQGIVLPLLFDQLPAGPLSSDTTACTQVQTCDDTLIHVTETGDLTVSEDGKADGPPDNPIEGADLDLYLFNSDAQGTVKDLVDYGNQGTTENASETISVPLIEPGYYVARVRFYNAINGSYTAKASLVEHVEDPVDEEGF
jgi:hypothetical protein